METGGKQSPVFKVKGLIIGLRADPPGKPPLLLMHGLLASRHNFALNLEALRSRYRLVLAELPGHGEALPCTDPTQLTPAALVEALDAARRRLQIPCWHLCGLSFGAGLTLRYALTYPEAVGAQIWTNGNRVLAPLPEPQEIARDQERAARLLAEGVEALRRESFHPRHGRRFPEHVRDLLCQDADACDIATIAGLMSHCLPTLSLRDRYAATSVPTLLVNGRMESRFQPVRTLALELLPSMDVVDLPGGHAINVEQPEPFDRAALDFLAHHDDRLMQR